MTIKFIADYPPYKIGNTVTLTSAEETALVGQNVATTDLTGGVPYVAPKENILSSVVAQVLSKAQSSHPGLAGVVGALENGDIMMTDGFVTTPVTYYDSVRKESRYNIDGGVKNGYFKVRNPNSGVSLTNYPVAVFFGFSQGEVNSLDQVVITNVAGNQVQFQWEPGVNPVNGTSIEKWDDGSFRAGTIWLNVNFSAGEEIHYNFSIFPNSRGQSFTKNVTFTAVSGTIDQLETGTNGVICRFESAQAWNMRRYQDKANSNFDLFTGSNGVFTRYQIAAGNAKLSHTPADVTHISKGLLDSNAFGYGVVFQDYQTSFSFNGVSGALCNVRYRVFADGSVKIDTTFNFTEAQSSASKQVLSQIIVGATGLTSGADATRRYNTYSYTGSNFLYGTYAIQRQSIVDVAGQEFTPAGTQESTTTGRTGWTGSTSISAGAVHRFSNYLCKFATGDVSNEFLRRFNPIVDFGLPALPGSQKARFKKYAKDFAEQVYDSLAPQWYGVKALLALELGYGVNESISQLQQWASSAGLTLTNPNSWLGLWQGATGLEFMMRNTRVLWRLREECRINGMTSNQALVESYIHAYADGIVLMEAASGSSGLIKLRNSAPTTALNSSAGGLAGIAASLAVGVNAGRLTVYNRIASALASAAFGGPNWSYDVSTDPILTPTTHYVGFQMYEAYKGFKLYQFTEPTGNLRNGILNKHIAESYLNEWFANLLYRQGRASTFYFLAAFLVLRYSDFETANELLRHVTTSGISVSDDNALMDGWQSTETGEVMMDVSAIVDAAYFS